MRHLRLRCVGPVSDGGKSGASRSLSEAVALVARCCTVAKGAISAYICHIYLACVAVKIGCIRIIGKPKAVDAATERKAQPISIYYIYIY